MSTIYAVFEKMDDQISSTFSEWNLWSTTVALLLVSAIAYGLILWEDPDIHPFLLLRQSTPAPVRQPGGSAVFRSLQRPHGSPLRSGLEVKDDGAPVWASGKDGDLRDIWKQAVAGSRDKEGQHPARSGRIFTIRGREEVFEHELGELSQGINIIGQELRDVAAKRVAVYLPNSVEFLNTLFAASFFGFSPILLPYRQPLEAVLGLLRKTSPDVLIAGAGTIPLTEVAHSCPQLKHVIWVVQQGSRHLDWNEVPEGFGGKVGVSVWHELIEEKKSSIEGDLPYDVDRPGDSFRLVTMWQKEDDEVGDVVEYTEANLVAGVSAFISSLPQKQSITPSDLLLPADSMITAYSLTVILAALYSNASVALSSVAGPDADLELSARLVAPTVIVASAETVARYHRKVKEQAQDAWFASIWYWLQSRALTAGRMPGGAFINRAMAPSTVSSVGTTPGQLRLLFVSERAHSGCPPLTSTALSDLRIFTGARVVYALTAPGVAGAVASTNVYDYRREDECKGEDARGSSAKHSHFGVPMSCLEIRLVDTADHKTTDEGNPRGEITVRGPAVVNGEAKLGILGTFRDDHTLSYL